MSFEGVFTPIPTFFDGEDISHEKITAHVQRLCDEGITGIVPLGTLGEFSSLTIEERKQVAETVVNAATTKVIVGAGTTTTRHSIELARHAEDIGADAVLVITPYFLKTDAEGLLAHYQAIHEHTSLPLIAYNLPQFTGIELPDEVILHLAEEETITGLKDTSGNLAKILNIINSAPKGFSVLTGADALFTSTVLHGGAGGIIGSSNVFPRKTLAMYQAAKRGDAETAAKIQMQLLPLINLIGVGTFPSAVKYMIEKTSGIASSLRRPLRDLTPEEKQRIDKVLELLTEEE